MLKYVKLLRITHYVKNGLIFFPLVFSGKLLNPDLLVQTVAGLLSFSFAASVVYIINDIKDVESDKSHPSKCRRPLASGAVSVREAIVLVIILLTGVVIINYIIAGLDFLVWGTLSLYLVSNLGYSFGLKNVPLMDVSILALGYILRVYYGATLIDVEVSIWLYLTITGISFFMGLGKRRNEMQKKGYERRKVLRHYTPEFLDKNMYMCMGAAVVFYSLWCESIVGIIKSHLILVTVPIVILICMKYSLNIESESDGDPINVFYNDKGLLGLIGVYIVIMAVVLYGSKLGGILS